MKRIEFFGAALFLLLSMAGTTTQAEVSAAVDRNMMALGDTVRLTITATEDEDLDDVDLRALLNDFEIVQRSSSSNTSIVNGRMSHVRQVIIDLTPNRQGRLQIPPLRIGQTTTEKLPVVVGATPDTPDTEQSVVFDVEVDQDTIYVQGQVILTLRLQQAVELEGRGTSELKLDKAFVKPLEQRSFQRTINGRQWLVNELRYAIFPEQSGTLEIPAQEFTGRIKQRQRSFFDISGSGQLVRRSSEPFKVTVLPKPDGFTADTWLPARNLTLEETWSTPPEQLKVGESTTRTIRIQAEGLQGAQLPPVLFVPIDGLKYYPDQPQITEQETSSGLLGTRQDSAAVVPTRAGSYLLPETRITWWDTTTKTLRYAVLPERQITVTAAPGDNPSGVGAPDSTTGNAADTATPAATAIATLSDPVPRPSLIWPIATAVSLCGWLFTLLYLWLQRGARLPVAENKPENSSEKQAFKQLLTACSSGNAVNVRGAIIAWAGTMRENQPPISLEQVALAFHDEELTQELERLDAQLYGSEYASWSGDQLIACARRLRGGQNTNARNTKPQLRLYPEATTRR